MNLEFDAKNLRILYESMRESIIDIASMDEQGVAEMKKFLYEFAETGDILRVTVKLGYEGEKNVVADTVFLENGAHLPTLDTNVFLPYEGGSRRVVYDDIIISSHTFQFIKNNVFVDGEEVVFGTPFMVGGRRVVLAKGSVVLLLEDTLVRVFPESGVQNEVIINNGTVAVGDVTTTGVFQLGEMKQPSAQNQSSNPNTSNVSYVFFLDKSTDQRVCVLKRTHMVDFMQTTAKSLLDLGYLHGTLEKVLTYGTQETGIRSVSPGGTESVATIDVQGLAFSSNESAIVIGEFRLKYDEGSDAVHIQHLDKVSGEYRTKREFGR